MSKKQEPGDWQRLVVWHNGDPSVGLSGDQLFVDVDLRAFDASDRPAYLDQVKEAIHSAMAGVWEFQVGIMPASELPDKDQVRLLLEASMKYIEFPEEVDVDWLAAGLQRQLADASTHYVPEKSEAVELANRLLAQAGLATYSQAVSALSGAKPFIENVVSKGPGDYPLAYDYNMTRLAEVQQVLRPVMDGYVDAPESSDVDLKDAFRQARAAFAVLASERNSSEAHVREFAQEWFDKLAPACPHPAEKNARQEGVVLAFPGASEAEGEELLSALRATGATVFPVDFAHAQSVLLGVNMRRGDDPEVQSP